MNVHPARKYSYDILVNELDKRVSEGLIRKVVKGDLSLYNYTETCTYEKRWDDFTLMARGLILDTKEQKIVATPFPKFFNYGEMGLSIPNESFEVYEKLDGCFTHKTILNLWNGGHKTIGEIVENKLSVDLIGKDAQGNLVPTRVVDWHNNGKKSSWLSLKIEGRGSSKSNRYSNLKVTPNHEIFVNGSCKLAADIVIGDKLLAYDLSPDENIIHLIESSLLGDGCVLKSGHYQEPHSEKQTQYVHYLRKLMGNTSCNRSNTVSGYGSNLISVGSKSYEVLKNLRNKWYPNGKKSVPLDLTWMDDFSVAKWYMDDGSLSHSDKQNDRAVFSTNGFSHSDVERLALRLKELYSVNCTVYYSKGWCLRVNSGKTSGVRPKISIDRMWYAIASHIPPFMRYKLPEKWRNVPFIEYNVGKEIKIEKEAIVTGNNYYK